MDDAGLELVDIDAVISLAAEHIGCALVKLNRDGESVEPAATVDGGDGDARLETDAEYPHCWHCQVCLESEPKSRRPHCYDCPADGECDDADCQEPGCLGIPPRGANEPNERVDWDALEVLEELLPDEGYKAFTVRYDDVRLAIRALKAERARHAEETAGLRDRLGNLRASETISAVYASEQTERIAELESLLSATQTALLEARAERNDVQHRAEKAEAEAAELRERLEELEPRCLFSETVRFDERGGRLAPVPNAERFHCHHCRITVEALYPIGPAAEVSKPEGRDA